MRCKFCNIEISSPSTFCPLCHERLETAVIPKESENNAAAIFTKNGETARLQIVQTSTVATLSKGLSKPADLGNEKNLLPSSSGNENKPTKTSLELQHSQDEIKADFPKKVFRKHYRVPIDWAFTIYTFIASVIFLICLTINLIESPEPLWSGIVGAVLLYGIFLIKNTILSTISIGQKIFWQGVYFVFLLWTIQHITKSGNWLLEYGLPFVTVFAVLSVIITMIIRSRFAKNYFLSLFALSLTCFVPSILFACKIYPTLWPSLTATIIGSVAILFVTIFGYKTLFPEFVRKFHF